MQQTHLLNLSLIKPVGEISQKRINIVASHGFQIQKVISNEMAHFIEDGTGHVIIIAKNQISFAPNPTKNEEALHNPTWSLDIFNNILDLLLLDGNSFLRLDFERSYKSDFNTHEKSMEYFSDPESVRAIGSSAIGYRIPFKDGELQGEIRAEPFFADTSKFFLACNLQTTYAIEQAQLYDAINNIFKTITDKFEPFIQRMFIMR